MKKLLCILLAFCMVFCLSGCNSKLSKLLKNKSETNDDTNVSSVTENANLKLDNYIGVWFNPETKNEFTVIAIDKEKLSFKWSLYRLAGIDETTSINLKNNTAVFYVVSGDNTTFIKKATIELLNESIDVTVENVGATDKNCFVINNPSFQLVEEGIYSHTRKKEQVISVATNRSDATLTLSEFNGKEFTDTFSCPAKVGKDGTVSASSESSSATPAGQFNILFAFGLSPVSTGLEYKTLNSNSIWIDDSYSAYYNTLQDKTASYADWSSYENIYNQFANGFSTCCIAFDFNGDCENANTAYPDSGSVIFIDGKPGALSPTYGDVAISSDDMAVLVSKLDAKKKPIINIY